MLQQASYPVRDLQALPPKNGLCVYRLPTGRNRAWIDRVWTLDAFLCDAASCTGRIATAEPFGHEDALVSHDRRDDPRGSGRAGDSFVGLLDDDRITGGTL